MDGTIRVIATALCVAMLFTACSGSGKYITYEQFGAIGDGVHDDFPAIVEAHEAANEKGLPVKADDEKTYLLKGDGLTAVIKTDVDFGKARFIIDDVGLEHYATPIFSVMSNLEPVEVKGVASLSKDRKSLGVTLPCRSLVEVFDDTERVYIRRGLNQNDGTAKTEVFVADAYGNIEDGSALVWDYGTVTRMIAYPIDGESLTIKGGIFTTIANRMPSEYTYNHRGFQISRSNVTVRDMVHLVEGELDHGAPYNGFLSVGKAADILVTGCTFTARKTYVTIGSAGLPVPMGSYDLGASQAVNIRWEHCRQTTDIDDRAYWGLFGSNFCKNLSMDDVVFSRFDAHMGVKDVTLTNSKFGYMGVQMVGFGTALIDNCEIKASRLIGLREDYGSSWNGEIIIRNSRWISPDSARPYVNLFTGSNDGTHDFGYDCCLPDRIEMENVIIDDKGITNEAYAGPNIFATFDRDVTRPGLLPFKAEGQVILKNVTVTSGKPLGISTNEELFAGYGIVRE